MGLSQFPPAASGIPTGTTATRPASPVTGDVFYNGTLGILEIYDGTTWIACSAPPASPSIISAVDVGTDRPFGSAQATVTLSPGAGGGTVINYTAVGSLSGTDYTTTSSSTVATLTVANAGNYSISAKANNNFGSSVLSPSTSVSLTTVPQAPTIGTAATIEATTDVLVTWTLGNDGGKNLTSITVTPYLNGTTAQTATTAATTTATSATITGLTSGSSYTFKVKATNANGTGLESSASNSITVPQTFSINYLVVAGGGGGGGNWPSNYDGGAGGGGAGGLRSTVTATGGGGSLESALNVFPNSNYTVTVGAGGSGGNNDPGVNGSDSVFATITSIGGGGGGSGNNDANEKIGKNGGSGGGGGTGLTNTGGTGTANQGYAGGLSNEIGINGGGGGGAGAVGGNANSGSGGTGGAGVATSITGSSVTRGGGGGGGTYVSSAGGGGAGGGGAGSGNNGTVNTGGGGGGGSNGANPGGSGGSGVVILRWLTSAGTISVGAGLTANATGTDGSYSYKVFTAGTGNVSWS